MMVLRTSSRLLKIFLMTFRHQLAIVVVGAVALAACGSADSDSNSSAESTASEPSSTDDGGDDETGDIDESAQAGSEGGSGTGSGTLTLDDGTAFSFEFASSCDTSNTNPSALPLSNGYDVNGRTTDDAFQLVLIRAGLSDDASIFTGSLEGDFDDSGKNSLLIYVVDDATLNVNVDGASLSGTFEMRAIAPNRPYGDRTGATIDVAC